MSRVPFTYTWIEQDKILAGSIPQLSEDFEALAQLGIKSITTLTRRDISGNDGFHEFINVGHRFYTHIPIPDGGLASDCDMLWGIAKFASNIHNSFSCPAYLHCRGGIGRTGTILLGYYVLHCGMTLAEAQELVKVRRNYEGNASAIDQGSPQREWIDKLPERRHEYWSMCRGLFTR